MSTQLERSLQAEILLRLKAHPVVAVPSANGLWVPARSEQEQALVARIINRMKTDGMLLPGAPDLVLLGGRGALCVELKRPASRDLFMRRPRGRLSPEQKAFKRRCEGAGVRPEILAASGDALEARKRALTLNPAHSPRRAQWPFSDRRMARLRLPAKLLRKRVIMVEEAVAPAARPEPRHCAAQSSQEPPRLAPVGQSATRLLLRIGLETRLAALCSVSLFHLRPNAGASRTGNPTRYQPLSGIVPSASLSA